MPTNLAVARAARRVPTALVAIGLGATALLGAVPAAASDTSGSTTAATATVTRSGVFEGGIAADKVRTFEAWRGTPVGVVSSFAPSRSWADISIPSWYTSHWGSSEFRDRMVVTLAMLPKDDHTTSLAVGATGAYNEHFRRAAQNLVAAGMGNARIRVGHELNGSWYRWYAGNDPAAYAEYYRQIVTTMRSVPGQSFTFEWNVSVGVTNFDATTAYPGGAYVDYIGQDVYDVKWGDTSSTPESRWRHKLTPGWGTHRHGLQFWADFAKSSGKPLAFSEWGLTDKHAQMANGGGGGDSPYFIERMREWMSKHPTAYEVYFNEDASDGKHDLNTAEFPAAADRYRLLF